MSTEQIEDLLHSSNEMIIEKQIARTNTTVTSSVFNLSSYDMHDVKEELEKTQYCCELDNKFQDLSSDQFIPNIDSELDTRNQARPIITIEDATKAHDMSGKPYTSYIIKTTLDGYKIESRHRYSEFGSLHSFLQSTFPSVIVPPIPDKHSVAQYAAKPGKALQDPKVIFKRKIMLQNFLNRIASHNLMKSCHAFHVFLIGETPWNEVLSLSGAPLKRRSSIANIGIELRTLRKPDMHFVDAQDYTSRFGNQIVFIRKIFKKIISLYQDLSATYTDLGGMYNGWSLSEQNLSESVEQVGQAIDSSLTSTNILYQSLEEKFGDTLKEYERFTESIQSVLSHRHRKHAEFEIISEQLISKQQTLGKLEAAEHESQRLAAILSVEAIPIGRPAGIIAQINALIDNDPESTRRATISKTKDVITGLEQSREQSRLALLQLNGEIQRDLDRFQKQKNIDIRNLMVAFCMAHREYHGRCINAWNGTRDIVDKIVVD